MFSLVPLGDLEMLEDGALNSGEVGSLKENCGILVSHSLILFADTLRRAFCSTVCSCHDGLTHHSPKAWAHPHHGWNPSTL